MPLVVAWAMQHKESERCRTCCPLGCPLRCLAADFNILFLSGDAISPKLVEQRAAWSNDRFFNHEQQDVPEAFDTFFAACNSIDENFAFRFPDVQNRRNNSNVMLTTSGHFIFGGLQTSFLHCQNCRQYSRKLEAFTSLSLPLSGNRPFNLNSLFRNYQEWEMCERNTRCSGCAVAGCMQKCIQFRLENLPRVLFLSFKRFAQINGNLRKAISATFLSRCFSASLVFDGRTLY